MKAYIQVDQYGHYYNVNAFVAATGYEALGFEIFTYEDVSAIQEDDRDAIFIGGVGMVRARLKQLDIPKEEEIEYPEELVSFLKRNVWKASLSQLIKDQTFDIFIKPIQTKLFQGKVIHQFNDYIGLNFDKDITVWCSEVVDIVTEWRCFIRYGNILDVRYYKGDWDSQLDLTIVKAAVESFKAQPAAYCLDFGVDKNGQHYLVEVNDGHSLGTYGMGAISYAKFLSARWAELTSTPDQLNF